MSAEFTPEELLFLAASKGDTERVKEIIRKNPKIDLDYVPADPNKLDSTLQKEGNTALLQALSKENLAVAEELLKQKANPWKLNQFNLNALHMLAMVNHDMDKGEVAKLKLEQIKSIYNILST